MTKASSQLKTKFQLTKTKFQTSE